MAQLSYPQIRSILVTWILSHFAKNILTFGVNDFELYCIYSYIPMKPGFIYIYIHYIHIPLHAYICYVVYIVIWCYMSIDRYEIQHNQRTTIHHIDIRLIILPGDITKWYLKWFDHDPSLLGLKIKTCRKPFGKPQIRRWPCFAMSRL